MARFNSQEDYDDFIRDQSEADIYYEGHRTQSKKNLDII